MAAENQAKPASATVDRQLRAAEVAVHRHADQIGLRERVQRLLDLRDDGDLLAVEARLVRVALLVVRREVSRGQLLAQVEHAVERLAGVLGEALPLGQLVDAQPFVEQEVEVAPRQQGGLHPVRATSRRQSMPSGDSTRTVSSRIRPRSSAVLNSTAISCAVRLPCGRSQR